MAKAIWRTNRKFWITLMVRAKIQNFPPTRQGIGGLGFHTWDLQTPPPSPPPQPSPLPPPPTSSSTTTRFNGQWHRFDLGCQVDACIVHPSGRQIEAHGKVVSYWCGPSDPCGCHQRGLGSMPYHIALSGKDGKGVFRYPEIKDAVVSAPWDDSSSIKVRKCHTSVSLISTRFSKFCTLLEMFVDLGPLFSVQGSYDRALQQPCES